MVKTDFLGVFLWDNTLCTFIQNCLPHPRHIVPPAHVPHSTSHGSHSPFCRPRVSLPRAAHSLLPAHTFSEANKRRPLQLGNPSSVCSLHPSQYILPCSFCSCHRLSLDHKKTERRQGLRWGFLAKATQIFLSGGATLVPTVWLDPLFSVCAGPQRLSERSPFLELSPTCQPGVAQHSLQLTHLLRGHFAKAWL